MQSNQSMKPTALIE